MPVDVHPADRAASGLRLRVACADRRDAAACGGGAEALVALAQGSQWEFPFGVCVYDKTPVHIILGGIGKYLWLDALTQKVREDGRTVNVSVVVATAVNGEGKREIIGMDVGTSEDGAFLAGFPTLAVRQGPRWGGAGGLGRSSGTPRRHRRSLLRGQLATVPHPLHDQLAHSGPQTRSALRGNHGPHHLPATLPR